MYMREIADAKCDYKHFCFPTLSAMVNLCELNKKLVLCRLEMFTLAQILNPC